MEGLWELLGYGNFLPYTQVWRKLKMSLQSLLNKTEVKSIHTFRSIGRKRNQGSDMVNVTLIMSTDVWLELHKYFDKIGC